MWWWIVFWFGWILFGGWLVQLLPIYSIASRRTLGRLSDLASDPAEWPLLSVIVPARDEGPHVRAGLQSLLSCDYPNLEVIAVNDRSRDDTGQVMQELATADPRLKVIHITDLLPGWLGKNHAMHCGQQAAKGEWILFTDGDVVFQSDAVRRAVRYSISERIDHLTLFPRMIPGGYWENSVVIFFSLAFMCGTKANSVRNGRNKSAYAGVGAFNLVRKSAYAAVGGHQPLAMEILDDVRLGHLLKDHGFHCDILTAGPAVSVRWQHSLWGTIRGLEKNGFAALRFSVGRLISMSLALFLGVLLPYIVPIVYPDLRAIGYIATLVIMHVTYGYLGWKMMGSIWMSPAYPFAMALMQFAFLRSGWITLRQGGVYWRDTFYPLATLRANVYRPKVVATASDS